MLGIVFILLGEILSWSLMRLRGLKRKMAAPIRVLAIWTLLVSGRLAKSAEAWDISSWLIEYKAFPKQMQLPSCPSFLPKRSVLLKFSDAWLITLVIFGRSRKKNWEQIQPTWKMERFRHTDFLQAPWRNASNSLRIFCFVQDKIVLKLVPANVRTFEEFCN